MRLFTYKLTHDTGFAPNPFGAYLTLATCKPLIRRHKEKGDWIAGFTSVALCGDPVGSERLIYLMKIAEKVKIRDYFNDSRFQDKIPNRINGGSIGSAGDNIYRPIIENAFAAPHFEQLENFNHWDHDGNQPCEFHRNRDVSGQYVLVAEKFYYFGRAAISLPQHLGSLVSRGVSGHGKLVEKDVAQEFIDYVSGNYEPGRNGMPHDKHFDNN